MTDVWGGLTDRDRDRTRRGFLAVLKDLRERPRLCQETLGEERGLCTLAWCNGLFSLLFPGGYVTGWTYAGLLLPQQGYGLLTTLFAIYATFGIVHGSIKHRVRTCALGMALAGVTGFFVFLANPLALPIPMFVYIIGRRLSILGKMGDAAGAAADPSPPR